MSRGLDVPSLDCVINYKCPRNVETYVHRIGRTARGMGQGQSFTIVTQEDKYKLERMLESVENGDKLTEYAVKNKFIQFHTKYMEQYTSTLDNVLHDEQTGDLEHNECLVGSK